MAHHVKVEINTRKRFIIKDVETEIDSTTGSIVIENKKIYSHSDNKVGDFIVAARKEGELHSKLRHLKTAGEADAAEVAKLEKELKNAADNATSKRKLLTDIRTRRILNQVKRASRMNNRPRP